MKKLIFCIFGFLLYLSSCSSCVSTEKSNAKNLENDELLGFMVYGNDFLTSIALPNTWNVDMAYAKQVGINGFFYLRNYGIDNSPAIIVLDLHYNQNKIFEEWINNSINDFLEYYPEEFTSELKNWNIVNENGYKIVVYCLKHNTRDIIQYSAYIDVGLNYYVNIYVTIKDISKHDETVNDFKKCLENSNFTGIGVNVIEK
jgi:hypothetical protein